MSEAQTLGEKGQNLGEGIDEMVAHAEAIIAMAKRLGHGLTPSGAQTQDSGGNGPGPHV